PDPLHTDFLLLLAPAVPPAIFLPPSTPVFGGAKHWVPAYPPPAPFPRPGLDLSAQQLEQGLPAKTPRSEGGRPPARPRTAALTMIAPYAITRHSHPFGLSAYVPFVGGTAGGADLGLNRQFWGFTTESLGPFFEENAKPGDTVYIMDTSWPSWQRLI